MKILIVVSNYNEEKEITNTINDIKDNSTIDADLLIIDNCSQDKSIELVKESKVEYIQHPVNSGSGGGVIKTAFLYSYLMDYDIYCHLDGDNQHSAEFLNELIAPIMKDEADIIIGSRFIKKEGFQSLFLRRIGIRTFSKLLSWITKNSITDITSGFRAYSRKAIVFFGKQYKHEFEVVVQMIMLCHYANLRIEEVPVIMKPRLTGKSEINFKNAIKFPIYGIISIIGTMFQRKQIKELSDGIVC
jgi:GT2 family glycosyltransferase